VLAQFDVTFSNSTIEAWWRSLKHRLFVEEHNAKMPHSAFAGQTPDGTHVRKGVAAPQAASRR